MHAEIKKMCEVIIVKISINCREEYILQHVHKQWTMKLRKVDKKTLIW